MSSTSSQGPEDLHRRKGRLEERLRQWLAVIDAERVQIDTGLERSVDKVQHLNARAAAHAKDIRTVDDRIAEERRAAGFLLEIAEGESGVIEVELRRLLDGEKHAE